MIDLLDIRYVRLGTRDLIGADRFARDVLGLERVRIEAGAHYYRSDERDHTLVYFEGDPRDHTVGFELRQAGTLDAAAAQLSDRGLAVRPGSTDAPRDEAFWCGVLGARVSDRIGDAALLRIDPVHHKVALFPTTRSGIQHVNHQVASIDDVMRAWYQLREMGVKIVFGPGRHPTSGAVFLYLEGPDGMVFEYSTGVRCIAPEDEARYRPRQFPSVPSSFCMWGSLPDIPEFRKANA